MPVYRYDAVDKYGLNFRGRISRLSKNNIMPLKVKKMQNNRRKELQLKKGQVRRQELSNRVSKDRLMVNEKKKISISYAPIKINDVIQFAQNLYLLKKADFNNIHALETLLKNIKNEKFRVIIDDILNGVESGQNMYTIMEYYPDVFPPIFVGIVKSGELSGTLVNSLYQARVYLETSYAIKTRLKSILLPNVAQFVVIMILLFAGVILVIPKIEDIYSSLGLLDKLPPATMKFANFVKFLTSIWYVVVAVVAAIVFIIYMYIKTPEGRYKYDLFKYRLPVFGQLIVFLDTQKFLNALRLNIENGIRLQDSLDVSKEVVANTVFLSIIETCKNNLILGEDWVEPIERSNIFPDMLPEMLKIGMSTDLGEMLEKIEEYMKTEIDRKIARTIKVLPELSYAIVGVILVIFVIIVMVPIMQVYMGSFLFDAYL